MANNVAFRFLGKMANDCPSIVYNASTGNIPMLAVDVGLKVLELTESVISYSEEVKRTEQLHKQIDCMKDEVDTRVELESEKAKERLILVEQKLCEDLKLEKVKLSKDLDEYRRLVEININESEYKYEEQKKINNIVMKNVYKYKSILNKIEACINAQSKCLNGKTATYDLHEEFRRVQTLYNKLIVSINLR